MDKFAIVYITTANREEADKLARVILSEKLAACVNIYDNVKSLYLLEGSLESSNETTMIVKTISKKVAELVKKISEEHSYKVPCILSVNIEHISDDYARWISAEISTDI